MKQRIDKFINQRYIQRLAFIKKVRVLTIKQSHTII